MRSLRPAVLTARVCFAQVLAQIGAYTRPAFLPSYLELWRLDSGTFLLSPFFGVREVHIPLTKVNTLLTWVKDLPLRIPVSMVKMTTGLSQALGLGQAEISLSNSSRLSLLSLGLGALGLLIRETGFALMTFSSPHSVIPVLVTADRSPRCLRTVPAETSFSLSSLNLVKWWDLKFLRDTPESGV